MAAFAAPRNIRLRGAPLAPGPRLLWAVGLTGLAAAVAAFALALTSDHVPEPGLQAALVDWITVPYILGGLVAWSRRPDSRFGPLMIAAGFAMFVSTPPVGERASPVHDRAGLRPPARGPPAPCFPRVPERTARAPRGASRRRRGVFGGGRRAGRQDAARRRRQRQPARRRGGTRCGQYGPRRSARNTERPRPDRRRPARRPPANLRSPAATLDRAADRLLRARARDDRGPSAGRCAGAIRVRDHPAGHLRRDRDRPGRLPDRAARRPARSLRGRRLRRRAGRRSGTDRPPGRPLPGARRSVPGDRLLAAGVRELGGPGRSPGGAARARQRSGHDADRPRRGTSGGARAQPLARR